MLTIALIIEILASLCRVSVSFLSAFGIGLLFCSKHKISSFWQFFLATTLGFLTLSQLHYYALALSIYRYEIFLSLKIVTSAWGAIVLFRSDIKGCLARSSKSSNVFKLSLLTYFVIIVLLLLLNSASLAIDGDAIQYHLSLPWAMSLSQSQFKDNSFIGTGIYQGFDLLYMYITNLALLDSDYSRLLDVKVFSILAGLLLPVSIYYLSRFMKAGKNMAILASLALFSVSSILAWGTLKNDVVTAGMFVFFLATLTQALQTEQKKDLFVASALAGFSISGKVTNIVFYFFLILLLFLSKKVSFRSTLLALFITGVIAMPWAWLAYTTQGHPLHPAVMNLSPALELAWEQRNANGLELSLSNWLIYAPQLSLDRYHIPGNQSLGIPFVLCFLVSCISLLRAMVRRRVTAIDIIFLSGLLWFLLFSIRQFEGRFLSRYLLNFVGVTFAYAFTSINSWTNSQNYRHWVPRVLLLLLIFFAGFTNFTRTKFLDLKYFYLNNDESLALKRQEQFKQVTHLELRSTIAEIRGSGAVAVNDAFILLIPPPFVNVHGLHSPKLDFYEKDAEFLNSFLLQRDVSVLIIRPEISGITPALLKFLEHCGELNRVVEGREIYKVKPQCRSQQAS